MATWNERPGAPPGLARGKQGRWLGGVCVGLAAATGRRVAWLRAAFVVGALVGGLGIALYLACWLIIPEQGDGDEPAGPAGVVVMAQACAACAALLVLAAIGAAATVFGFGWVVVGAAAAHPDRRARRQAAARAGVDAAADRGADDFPRSRWPPEDCGSPPRSGSSTIAPASAQDLQRRVYRSGLNTMLVDLRRTQLPATGTVPLHIAAGVRRTIVALPSQRCVRVVVHYHVNPFAVRLAALLVRPPSRWSSPTRSSSAGSTPSSTDTVTPPARSGAAPGHRLQLAGGQPVRPRLPRLGGPHRRAQLARVPGATRAAPGRPGDAEEGRRGPDPPLARTASRPRRPTPASSTRCCPAPATRRRRRRRHPARRPHITPQHAAHAQAGRTR